MNSDDDYDQNYRRSAGAGSNRKLPPISSRVSPSYSQNGSYEMNELKREAAGSSSTKRYHTNVGNLSDEERPKSFRKHRNASASNNNSYSNTTFYNDAGKLESQVGDEEKLRSSKSDNGRMKSSSRSNVAALSSLPPINRNQVGQIDNGLIRKEGKSKNKQDDGNESSDFDEDSDDENDQNENRVQTALNNVRNSFLSIFSHPYFKIGILVLVLLAYPVYFGFAMKLNNPFAYISKINNETNVLDEYIFSNNRGLALLVITIIVAVVALWDNIFSKIIPTPSSDRIPNFIKRHYSKVLIALVFLGSAIYVGIDVKDSRNFVSLAGMVTFILIVILMSKNPTKINWHILFVGLEIQFVLGVFLMRVDFGYQLFRFIGQQVAAFLDYTNAGASFVFGDNFLDHFFAFKAMSVVVFFGAVVNLLFYLGTIKYLILKLAWVVNGLMGTSPTESMNATANIFLGQTEAPLLIKPFLRKMTNSEIFSVMVGGFATVAGAVLAAYIGYNVPANHLIIASLLAAPGALAVSKTMYPETKKTKANWDAIRNLPKGDETGVFEAISKGASNMIGPVAGIVSNLIAFTSFFAFLDGVTIWVFGNLNMENFGLTSIIQYLFWPFAFLMGVNTRDCSAVARLVGSKIFVNEFYAYAELGKAIDFKAEIIANGTYDFYLDGTYPLPVDLNMIWDDRSILISTYALCGFANFASVGIQIGGMTALEPKKFKVFSKLAVKAMIAGNITNFITACIAGLLYTRL